MATKRHSNDDEIQPVQAGGSVAQGIVELLSATASGLVFWSRHPFEIAAELQLRVRSSALPSACSTTSDEWQVKSGFVVQCKPARRATGAVGFHISVLFVSEFSPSAARKLTPADVGLDAAKLHRLVGWN